MNDGEGVVLRPLRRQGEVEMEGRGALLLFILLQVIGFFVLFQLIFTSTASISTEKKERLTYLLWQQELPGITPWLIQTEKMIYFGDELALMFSLQEKRGNWLLSNLPGFPLMEAGWMEEQEEGEYHHHDEAPTLQEILEERTAIPLDKLKIIVGEKNLNVEWERDKNFLSKKAPVFIYHTHNRESWFPYLPETTKVNQAFHPEINVTLLGNYLQRALAEHGIASLLSDIDYIPRLDSYKNSYAASRETVEATLATNQEILYLFDLHRDALPRDKSTITINGKDYAKVMFVIGAKNPQWEQNKAFAQALHDALERSYPGLSRGIMVKQPHEGNAEYNQSLHPQLVLMEIGGVENTLEESYRTLDALAAVVTELYWEAVPVNKNGGSAQ